MPFFFAYLFLFIMERQKLTTTKASYDPPTSAHSHDLDEAPLSSSAESCLSSDEEEQLTPQSNSTDVTSVLDPLENLRREGLWLQLLGTGGASVGCERKLLRSALSLILKLTLGIFISVAYNYICGYRTSSRGRHPVCLDGHAACRLNNWLYG